MLSWNEFRKHTFQSVACVDEKFDVSECGRGVLLVEGVHFWIGESVREDVEHTFQVIHSSVVLQVLLKLESSIQSQEVGCFGPRQCFD